MWDMYGTVGLQQRVSFKPQVLTNVIMEGLDIEIDISAKSKRITKTRKDVQREITPQECKTWQVSVHHACM